MTRQKQPKPHLQKSAMLQNNADRARRDDRRDDNHAVAAEDAQQTAVLDREDRDEQARAHSQQNRPAAKNNSRPKGRGRR